IDDVVGATFDGNLATLDRALDRVFAEGGNAVQLVRALQRHADQLHLVSGHAKGGNLEAAMFKARGLPRGGPVRRRFENHLGRWQSSWDMDRWGGPAAIKLLAYGRNVANRLTTDQEGTVGKGPYPGHFAVTWIGNMWANVNRSGHGNEYHSHPGSYWSGTYYVDDGGIAADPSLGGELEFLDPRGPVPLMNAPHLRMAGHLSAG